MSVAADRIARLRAAAGHLTPVAYPPPAAPSDSAGAGAPAAWIEELRVRLNELRGPGDMAEAMIEVSGAVDLVKAIGMICRADGRGQVVLQDDALPAEERAIGITPALAAIASSGTVVLDLPTPEAGYASLLVEHHVAVLDRARVFPDVASFYARLGEWQRAGLVGRYQVSITGCSRTADIEKLLVVPAHGPKRFTLVVSAESFAWEGLRRQLA